MCFFYFYSAYYCVFRLSAAFESPMPLQLFSVFFFLSLHFFLACLILFLAYLTLISCFLYTSFLLFLLFSCFLYTFFLALRFLLAFFTLSSCSLYAFFLLALRFFLLTLRFFCFLNSIFFLAFSNTPLFFKLCSASKLNANFCYWIFKFNIRAMQCLSI